MPEGVPEEAMRAGVVPGGVVPAGVVPEELRPGGVGPELDGVEGWEW